MKTRVAYSILFFMVVVAAQAQDYRLSQFFANPMHLNPAFTSIEGKNACNANYRRNNISNVDFTTSIASMELSMSPQNSLGFLIVNDNQGGLIRENSFLVNYNYRMRISPSKFFNLALQTGFRQRSIHTNELIFEDQISPRSGVTSTTAENIGNGNKAYLDFAAGFSYISKKYYFGYSTFHLTTPNVSVLNNEDPLSRRHSIQAGMKFRFNEFNEKVGGYSPNIIYHIQGASSSLLFGNYVRYRVVNFGMWYDWNDRIIGTIGFNIDEYQIGYSYDTGLKNLTQISSHEISFRYTFEKKKKKKKKLKDDEEVVSDLAIPNF